MALILNEIIFDYPAPSEDETIEEISRLTALEVIKVDPYENDKNSDDEYDDEYDDEIELYQFIQHIAFKDFPKYYIKIYAYIPGAVNKSVEKEKQETGFDANWPRPLHGVDEEEGKQSVHIEGHLGMETTLFLATIKALESLGGQRRYQGEYNNALQDYPLTIEKLVNNYKKVRRWNWSVIIIQILLLPILLPLALIKAIIGIIKMPFEINRGMKAIKKHYPEYFKNKK